MATICAGLCAVVVPGCALLPSGRATTTGAKDDTTHLGPGQTTASDTAAGFVRPRPDHLPDGDPLAIFALAASPYHPVPDHYLLPAAGAAQTAGPKPFTADHPHDEAQGAVGKEPSPAELRHEHPEPSVKFQPASLAEQKEPLLVALECFLKNQPEKALEVLKTYQHSSQDVYISLLPVLAQLTHKGVDQLSPEEASAIDEQMHGLAASLRSRAKLVIDKACFCEWIKSYGSYKALPEQYYFRPQTPEQQGEVVHLYVELRNFSMAPCPQGYLTRLSSSVEIRDPGPGGKQQWYYSFKEQEGPLYKQTPWHDCFGNYRFYMPRLPPGTYTLTITIRDLTRPEAPRVAKKSLELRVAS
jgi:hypothetical protein